MSSYPPEIQEGYKVFSVRCSKCHTLARPVNAEYALPEEWSRYVKRMMRKPGSGISKKDGKKIYDPRGWTYDLEDPRMKIHECWLLCDLI